jgi:hypothetical protein
MISGQVPAASEPGCPARWAESSLVARSLSRQVRAARLTPKARWFQFRITFSTESLALPTPHPWPPRALAPIVAAALVARPKCRAWPASLASPGFISIRPASANPTSHLSPSGVESTPSLPVATRQRERAHADRTNRTLDRRTPL